MCNTVTVTPLIASVTGHTLGTLVPQYRIKYDMTVTRINRGTYYTHRNTVQEYLFCHNPTIGTERFYKVK